TPGGPNDPGGDADLLIAHGPLVLLQDDARATQTVPGFFDEPASDPDGGDLVFTFSSPAEPRSLVLADLDPPPNQGATVTLTDTAARMRTFTVPPGWTGTFGAKGAHTLDLTTLAPQVGNAPGFHSTAASETLGFAADSVQTLVVHLSGGGAVDDLAWCSGP